MNPTDFIENLSHKRRLVQRLFDEPVSSIPGNFDHIVDEALRKRAAILQLATSEATPFYLFDTQSFVAALTRFRDAFDAKIDRHRSFYAVKSNHHPYLVETAVEQGYGLDVSSGRELRQALDAGASEILFSGPAKSIADLALALDHASRVTINIDSFSELRKLGQLTQEREQTIRAGVRITTAHHGSWSKFGISLDRLPEFWNAAAAFPLIQMQGIQSHLSWTRQPTPYQQVIADVAKVLREQLTPAQRAAIKFYDFGGGYRPYRIEGFYPQETSQGELIAIADGYYGEESQYRDRYYVHDSADLPAYAEGIGTAIDQHLRPIIDCDYFSEPGRVVSSFAMHLVMQVVDRKDTDLVIVDAGIHMIGWERYLHVYAPLINLTQPARTELSARIYGSLCDPEDTFGKYCFAEGLAEGDVLVMPNQGAYSYATAQNFIRPIPAVHRID